MAGAISYSYPQLLAAADQLRVLSEECLGNQAATPDAAPESEVGEAAQSKREPERLQASAEAIGDNYQAAVSQVSRTLARTAETLRSVAEDYRRTEEETRALVESRLSEIGDAL